MTSNSRPLQVKLHSGTNRPLTAPPRGTRTEMIQRSLVPSYFLALPPGFVEDGEEALFDKTGEALGCPKCKCKVKLNPTMKLNYSKCCGCVMCESCLQEELRRGAKSCSTPGCVGDLDKSSWSSLNIDKQRYKGAVDYRKKLQKDFCLRPEDFADRKEYDDYLEFVEDVIYDLSYGNNAVKKAAEQKIDEFKQKYNQQIRRIQVVMELLTQTKAAAGTVQANYAINKQDIPKDYMDLSLMFGRPIANITPSTAPNLGDKYTGMDPWEHRHVQLAASGHGYTRDRDLSEALEALSF